MMKMFKTPTIRERIQREIDEAAANYLLHSNAAEHHDALARMYQARTQRLSKMLAEAEAANRDAEPSTFPIVNLQLKTA